VRQRFSAIDGCAELRDGEARSPWEAAGAGVGPSRSRHRPPSTWIIENSPVPPDERRVPGAADADADQHTSEADCQPAGAHIVGRAQPEPSRRRAERGRRMPDQGVVQNGHLRIPIHYEGGIASPSLQWTSHMTPNTPLGHEPRCTVKIGSSLDSRHRQPVDLVVEALPVMTPNVAAVLARIVRSLRDLQEGEATTRSGLRAAPAPRPTICRTRPTACDGRRTRRRAYSYRMARS
jgi:hypothetical protein